MIMSVMGADTDDIIDAMTLTGNRISMETAHRNQMAKTQTDLFNDKKSITKKHNIYCS